MSRRSRTSLAAAPMRNGGSGTAVSSGGLFAAAQFETSAVRSFHKTIDISGDGINDQVPPVTRARDFGVGRHIVINWSSPANRK